MLFLWLLDKKMISCPFIHPHIIHASHHTQPHTRTGEGNKALLSPNQESDSDEERQEKKPGDQAQDKEKKKKKDDRPSDNTAEVGTVYHFHKLMNNIQ